MVKIKYSKLSTFKYNKIVKYFCEDLSASSTARLTGVNRKTVNLYYNRFREAILKHQLGQDGEVYDGELEIDESYFGPTRVRGKRGRGASKKYPVFGILKRDGKVYTRIVKNCTKEELLPIIKGKILEDSTVYSDGWKSYDGLVLNGYDHYRIYHSKNEFARGKNHINGIESFWSYAKLRLKKFKGIEKRKYVTYLKETEWRFNLRNDNLEKHLRKILKQYFT